MSLIEGKLTRKNAMKIELTGNGKTYTINRDAFIYALRNGRDYVYADCGNMFKMEYMFGGMKFSRCNAVEEYFVYGVRRDLHDVLGTINTVTASLVDEGIRFLCSDNTYQIVRFKDISNTLINTSLQSSVGYPVNIEYADDITVTTYQGKFTLTNTADELVAMLSFAVRHNEEKHGQETSKNMPHSVLSLVGSNIGIGCKFQRGTFLIILSKEQITFLQRGMNVTVAVADLNGYNGLATLSLTDEILHITYGTNENDVFVSDTELRRYYSAK